MRGEHNSRAAGGSRSEWGDRVAVSTTTPRRLSAEQLATDGLREYVRCNVGIQRRKDVVEEDEADGVGGVRGLQYCVDCPSE